MKETQKYTPKYWVGHNKNTDDVYINTAFKHRKDASDAMIGMFGYEWHEKQELEVVLIEIKLVIA